MVIPRRRSNGCDGRSGGRECEVEGGALGLGAGRRGGRPLSFSSVKRPRIILQTNSQSNCPVSSRPMASPGWETAYRGCPAESLSCDRPRGHAAQEWACQHGDEFQSPPITGIERKELVPLGGGRGEGKLDTGEEDVLWKRSWSCRRSRQVSLEVDWLNPRRDWSRGLLRFLRQKPRPGHLNISSRPTGTMRHPRRMVINLIESTFRFALIFQFVPLHAMPHTNPPCDTSPFASALACSSAVTPFRRAATASRTLHLVPCVWRTNERAGNLRRARPLSP